MYDNTERVTIVEDNDFLNTDVSEFVDGDYYLLERKTSGFSPRI